MNLHVVKLKNTPIFEQLQLEEALLRADHRNWCLINKGSSDAIVMGISGKVEEHLSNPTQTEIPVIQRFSGGGTVFVDSNTFFITFICNGDELGITSYPKTILQWTEEIYRPIFEPHPFKVTENDYTFGDKKFGGNAQCIQKQRFLHHSTLLWDFDSEKMKSLKMPPKMPSYRIQREHDTFLCKMKDYLENINILEEKLLGSLSEKFTVIHKTFNEIKEIIQLPHRKATKKLLRGQEISLQLGL